MSVTAVLVAAMAFLTEYFYYHSGLVYSILVANLALGLCITVMIAFSYLVIGTVSAVLLCYLLDRTHEKVLLARLHRARKELRQAKVRHEHPGAVPADGGRRSMYPEPSGFTSKLASAHTAVTSSAGRRGGSAVPRKGDWAAVDVLLQARAAERRAVRRPFVEVGTVVPPHKLAAAQAE